MDKRFEKYVFYIYKFVKFWSNFFKNKGMQKIATWYAIFLVLCIGATLIIYFFIENIRT